MRRALRRLLSSRGATGVEYALVLTFFVVGSIGAIEFLSDRAADETVNQADCVETRPPTNNCQLPAVIPPTTTTLPGTPPPPPLPPGQPPDPCDGEIPPASCLEPDPPVVPPPPNNQSTATDPGVTVTGSQINGTQSFTITNSSGVPQAGVVVEIQVKLVLDIGPPRSYHPQPVYATCTTDATGGCTLNFSTSEPGVVGLDISIFKITSTPPTTLPTNYEWTVDL